MKRLADVLTILAAVAAVVGGLSRLLLTPIIVDSRVYAGVAVILLLFVIAINTRRG